MKDITKDTIDRYVKEGIPTGDFLYAVLSNDLMEAFGRADEDNRRDLFEICQYIYNETPAICHGSKERINEWIKFHQQKRAREEASK
jgi:hypothetical protein